MLERKKLTEDFSFNGIKIGILWGSLFGVSIRVPQLLYPCSLGAEHDIGWSTSLPDRLEPASGRSNEGFPVGFDVGRVMFSLFK